MKKLYICLTLLLGAFSTWAQLLGEYKAYSTTTTNGGTALSYAVISARGFNSGTPLVTFVSATSDLSSSKIQSYKVISRATVTHTNSTVTLFVGSTNFGPWAVSQVVVIRHKATDMYERRVLHGTTYSTGTTNLILTAAPYSAVIPGDIVYGCTTVGAATIPVGVATVNASGGVIAGTAGDPLLLEVTGTSASTLNGATAVYLE